MNDSPGPLAEVAAQAFDLAAGSICIAQAVTEKEGNKDRRRKMELAVSDALGALKEARPDGGIPPEAGPEVLVALLLADKDRFPRELALRALIEWCATSPFSPNFLKVKDDKVYDAVSEPARAIGLADDDVQAVRGTLKSALDAHRHVQRDKTLLLGVGGSTLTRLTGAPTPNASSALVHQGARLHALLALGEGPAALGGMGISAGVWLLVGLADGDETPAHLAAVLDELDPATLQGEVVKAQVTFAEIILKRSGRAGFSEALEAMVAKRDAVAAGLEQRRTRNESDSDPVERYERILTAFNDGLKWMLDKVNSP